MTERCSYTIIGNGIAGITAAETLRNEDASAHITVVADHPLPVYTRPALKDYLAGRVNEEISTRAAGVFTPITISISSLIAPQAWRSMLTSSTCAADGA